MKKVALFIFLVFGLMACTSNQNEKDANAELPKSMIPDAKVDDGRGIGEFKEVKLNDPLDESMVDRGKGIYDLKCAACHKLSATRVVGPGFKGVTDRRKPEWIMNMITNVEIMLDQDPEAQKLLEECLTRMPNQNVSANDARALLEFFYANDAS